MRIRKESLLPVAGTMSKGRMMKITTEWTADGIDLVVRISLYEEMIQLFGVEALATQISEAFDALIERNVIQAVDERGWVQ